MFKLIYYSEIIPQNFSGIIEYNNSRKYFSCGKLHKEDGPAVINDDGSIEYWYIGYKYENQDELNKVIQLDNNACEYWKWLKENPHKTFYENPNKYCNECLRCDNIMDFIKNSYKNNR